MMTVGRRGQATKERVLEEACYVFAEKGYRDATHAEICRRAGTNTASINYYFESKEALYRAAFEHLAQRADDLYPLDGALSPSASPVDRLRAFVHGHLSRMFDPERLGYLHKMRMSEIFDPTGLLSEQLERRLARDRERILNIIRDLIGPDASKRELEWCELSVVGQCFMASPGPRNENKGPRLLFGLDHKEIDRLTEHIVAFSLAGIDAIRRKKAERISTPNTIIS
jgi:AcrR family transcriptional regulator